MEAIQQLKQALQEASAVVIGAGSGLSTAAGLTYSGGRFQRYFSDFIRKYGIRDMYSGGFFPFVNGNEYWAWWSRVIYLNRYVPAPTDVYPRLYELVRHSDYFVLTTNVDHQFQKAGFDKQRLFYTQGDYGLFQARHPLTARTYDNEAAIVAMMRAQGFVYDENRYLVPPEEGNVSMQVPTALLPRCPEDGQDMVPNLRCDDTFVEDAGWKAAARRYQQFLQEHQQGRVLYLELGVGMNTPGIIKIPFWQYTQANPQAVYACVNASDARSPEWIRPQAIAVERDIADVLTELEGGRVS
ncbi:NAD-dependent deacetylase [Megasphaera sp. WILCCON 0056]|uniref:SIR2 family NAD-dependent protein deacylase n=1 Tax=Megasphaera sp. WILCCON 0056 TaxID=3345340 RepID=UPI003A8034F2